MIIGRKIKEVLFQQGRTAQWLAEQIPCERTNVYNIFKRKDMNIALLSHISLILEYDFFEELSKEVFPAKNRKSK